MDGGGCVCRNIRACGMMVGVSLAVRKGESSYNTAWIIQCVCKCVCEVVNAVTLLNKTALYRHQHVFTVVQGESKRASVLLIKKASKAFKDQPSYKHPKSIISDQFPP